MRHRRISSTFIIVFFIIFLYIMYTIRIAMICNGVTHSAYRKRKKSIAKCMKQRKQLLIFKSLSLENHGYQNSKKCAKSLQFLYQINSSEHIIFVYVAHLPPRLRGGHREGELNDGDGVFPELVVANQTPEGLRIEVPDCFLQPNNPYRAIRVVVRTERVREAEAIQNRGTTDSMPHSNHSSSINNVAVCAPARAADVTENTSGSSRHHNGPRRRQDDVDRVASHEDTITVKVYHEGTHIDFNVPRGTRVENFTKSAEFITTVTIKWNIAERDLQDMVLRNGSQVVVTFQSDCNIRLERGHMDLFLN